MDRNGNSDWCTEKQKKESKFFKWRNNKEKAKPKNKQINNSNKLLEKPNIVQNKKE